MRQRPRPDTALLGSVVIALMLASIALLAISPPQSVAVAQGGTPIFYPYPPYPTDVPTGTPYPYPPYPTDVPTITTTPDMPYPYPPPETPTPTSTPDPYPYPPPDQPEAAVSVAQRASPGRSAPAGSVVLYTVDIDNQGEAQAQKVKVRFEFSPELAQLLDVQLTRSGAWVSRTDDGFVEIRDPSIDAGDGFQARIRLLVRPDATVGASLTSRISCSWSDDAGGGDCKGNRLRITIGAAAEADQYARLTVSPEEGRAGITFRFGSGDAFIPNEPVALWYDQPDLRTREVGRINADDDGSITFNFDSAGLKPGRHQMVAYGVWSGITATGQFQIAP